MIKSLAQLKRVLVEGVEFEITNHWQTELIGERRRVNRANTTGIYSIVPDDPENKVTLANNGLGSFLSWGKAPFWKFEGGVCGLYEDKEHTKLLIQIKVKEENNMKENCPPLAAMNLQVKDYFYATGKKAPNEVPSGAWYAYRAWRNSYDQQTKPFEVNEIPWGSKAKREAVDFVAALREAGVTEFAVTDASTSLLEGIHALVNAGAELVGIVMVKRQLEYDRAEERQGLKFKISG